MEEGQKKLDLLHSLGVARYFSPTMNYIKVCWGISHLLLCKPLGDH